MTTAAHLWAVAYDDVEGAARLRDELVRLGWERHDLLLEDVAVVVRHPDGTYAFDRKGFPAVANVLGCTTVGLLAGLVVGAPISGAVIGTVVGVAGSAAVAASAGIDKNFILDV